MSAFCACLITYSILLLPLIHTHQMQVCIWTDPRLECFQCVSAHPLFQSNCESRSRRFWLSSPHEPTLPMPNPCPNLVPVPHLIPRYPLSLCKQIRVWSATNTSCRNILLLFGSWTQLSSPKRFFRKSWLHHLVFVVSAKKLVESTRPQLANGVFTARNRERTLPGSTSRVWHHSRRMTLTLPPMSIKFLTLPTIWRNLHLLLRPPDHPPDEPLRQRKND